MLVRASNIDYRIELSHEDFMIRLLQVRDADFNEADFRHQLKVEDEILPLSPGDNVLFYEQKIFVDKEGVLQLDARVYNREHGKGALAEDLAKLQAQYPEQASRLETLASPLKAAGHGALSAVSNVRARLVTSSDAATTSLKNTFSRVFRPENYTNRGFIVKGLAIVASLAAFGYGGYAAYMAGSMAWTAVAAVSGLAFGYMANRRFDGYAKGYVASVGADKLAGWEQAAYQYGDAAARTWKGMAYNEIAPSAWVHPTAARGGRLAAYELMKEQAAAEVNPEPADSVDAERKNTSTPSCCK